jgi:hypothetical protein
MSQRPNAGAFVLISLGKDSCSFPGMSVTVIASVVTKSTKLDDAMCLLSREGPASRVSYGIKTPSHYTYSLIYEH